jgi:hypothetical protein
MEFATEQISRWLSNCIAEHAVCNNHTDISTPLPTRVVDVGNDRLPPRLLISNGRCAPYIALSHRWGASTLKTTTDTLANHSFGIPLDNMPKTFVETVLLVRALGFQYLWIDSLCIIQDDNADWIQEASRMAEIYTNARLTFAAACSSDSDGGLFTKAHVPGSEFDQSDEEGNIHKIAFPKTCFAHYTSDILDNRAWVLQEQVLSTRLVTFGRAELTWHCIKMRTCQCGGKLYKIDDKAKDCLRRMLRNEEKISARTWFDLTEEYTARVLTYSRDQLPALTGIAKRVPYPESNYVAGMWTHWLAISLLWYVGVYYVWISVSWGTEP